MQPGIPLLTAALRIDERVLHYLTGIRYLDERLSGLLEEIVEEDGELAPSHEGLAKGLADVWSGAEGRLPRSNCAEVTKSRGAALPRPAVPRCLCVSLRSPPIRSR